MRKTWIVLGLLLFNWGCGVKGKPLAPLEPQVMGHGLPEYRGSNTEVKPDAPGPEVDPKKESEDSKK